MRIKWSRFMIIVLTTILGIQLIIFGVKYVKLNNISSYTNNSSKYLLGKKEVINILENLPKGNDLGCVYEINIKTNEIKTSSLKDLSKDCEVEILISSSDINSLLEYLKGYKLYYTYIKVQHNSVDMKFRIKGE
jgi:hypothetical protein